MADGSDVPRFWAIRVRIQQPLDRNILDKTGSGETAERIVHALHACFEDLCAKRWQKSTSTNPLERLIGEIRGRHRRRRAARAYAAFGGGPARSPTTPSSSASSALSSSSETTSSGQPPHDTGNAPSHE